MRVAVALEPGGVTLVVEDEGPGLTAAEREALLNPDDEPPHDGMGLWIVVRFARLHRGDLKIEQPASGRGARFEVWLPARGGA